MRFYRFKNEIFYEIIILQKENEIEIEREKEKEQRM